jgi:hypothetical protein
VWMNESGVNKRLSRDFYALCAERGPGVENARIPEGAKAGVIYMFNQVRALSSYSW